MVMVCSCGTGEQLEISGPSVQEVKLSPGTLEVFYPHSASSVDLSEGHPLFCALKEEESGISFVNEVDDAHPMSRVYILGYACGGISIGDVDADGLVDIYCSGGASDSVLYRQVGDLRFEDVSGESGLSVRGVWSTSSQLVDVDNDGDLDIHVCNYDAPNLLYLNDGQGQFTEVGAAAGIAIKDASLSAHFADYDNDGDLDLVTKGRLYQNNTPKKNFVQVKLVGTGLIDKMALGAQVRITVADRVHTRQVSSSTGQGNQNSSILHFGLGNYAGPLKAEVSWIGGKQTTTTLKLNHLNTIHPQ